MKEGDFVEIRKAPIKKVAYSSVVGDLFHYGHLRSIKIAESYADFNVVGVITDEAVESYRSKPLANLQERKAIFSNLSCVDRVMVQKSVDPIENLKKLHEEFPEAEIILVRGDDWKNVKAAAYLKSIGGTFIQHPYYEKLSTMKIINKLTEDKDKMKNITPFSSLIKGEDSFDPLHDESNKVIISSKAETLKALQSIIKKAKIEKLITFTVGDWQQKKKELLKTIKDTFKNNHSMVRASVLREEGLGKPVPELKSITDLEPGNAAMIASAVEEMILQYKKHGFDGTAQQILVHQQTKDVLLRGNVYTCRKNTATPCCVINYHYSSEKDVPKEEYAFGTLTIPFTEEGNHLSSMQKEIFASVKEIQDLLKGMELDITFMVTRSGDVVLFRVQPLATKFIHAWGGTTSLQSLECHTLRYAEFPDKPANAITRSIYCEIRDRHHTVYFDAKDIQRWNNEGMRFLDKEERNRIIDANVEQMQRFFKFYEMYKDTDYTTKHNEQLFKIYDQLLRLVMENGAFFPSSREDIIQPIKSKIFSLIGDNDPSIFQMLTTPTEKDIFYHELKDKIVLAQKKNIGEKEILAYARKHPWRFINTYSLPAIIQFIKQELTDIDVQELEKELQRKEEENRQLLKKQKEYFKKSNGQMKELCAFLQHMSIIRLQNKNIWAGYELLFLDLFKEIAQRIGLSIEEYLFSYRIKDTKAFLSSGKKLSVDEIKKRQHYMILEISNDSVEYSYTPKYTKELLTTVNKSKDSLLGESGNVGKVVGRALVVTDDSIASLMKLKKELTPNDIYITTMTHPAMVSILQKVTGIVTDEGGVTSHAAIISRELDIPCIVGTREATRFFSTGDIVEVDAYSKFVRKLSSKEIEEYKAKHVLKEATQESEEITVTIPKSKIDNSMPYAMPFEKTHAVREHIGGKGQHLAKCASEFTVPQGVCITRRLYDEVMNDYLKNKKEYIVNLSEAKGVDELKKLRKFIRAYEFSDKAKNEILQHFNTIKGNVAVRSSASCEDSANLSFAGQFDTFLSVSEDRIFDAVKGCIASAFKEHPLLYGHTTNVDYSNFYMAMVMQQFIQSEKAGVLFSANPSDPKKKGIWIDANFGVGESVVSGKVKPDHYFISNDDKVISVADEKEVYTYDIDGELSISKKSGRVLSDDEIEQLLELGKTLKKKYNKEIECEWCFIDDKLHLLQVRPITTIKEAK